MARGETTGRERQRIAEKLLKMPYKDMVTELERLHSDLTINEWSDMYSRLQEYGRKNELGINYPISKRNPGGWGEMKEDDKSLDAIKDNFTPPGAEDEEEYYEDDGGRVYTWGELKKDIDDWVKKPDFGEQFANEDERKGYFNSDSTPNYRKIYKDFWDIGSNGAMSQISKDRAKELRDDIDTNDNGKIEKDEMADFQKSLDDYASKNKKGRDDIPVTTRR